MPLRFRLPATATDRVAFAYSPLLETVLSLHVLAEPKHHPLQHRWVRAMRDLPADVKRGCNEFAFVFKGSFPDFLLPPASDVYRLFEEELTLLEQKDPAELVPALLRPLWDHGGRWGRGLAPTEQVRSRVRERAGALGGNTDLAELVLDDPVRLVGMLFDFLRRYWEAAFAAEWSRLEPRLAEGVNEAGRRIARGGVYAVIGGLSPQLVVDEAEGEFGKNIPHDHTVEVTEENPLVLVPSVYVWPHVWVNCDPPWPLAVVYPAPAVVEEARPRIPSTELVRVLRSVADQTRLAALRLIAERPRSTQELAPLIGISEAGISKHLRGLAEAGVVSTRRSGYYVLYSLERERLESISDALLGFVDEPVAEPATAQRTRSRPLSRRRSLP